MISRIESKNGDVVLVATSDWKITEQQINRLKFAAKKEFGEFAIELGESYAWARAEVTNESVSDQNYHDYVKAVRAHEDKFIKND